MFTGSLRYNLDPVGNFADEEILDILEKLNLKEAFQEKDGLNTFVLSFLFKYLEKNFRYQRMEGI